MKVRTLLTLDGSPVYDETTSVDEAAAAMDAALAKLAELATGHTSDGSATLTVTALVPAGVSTTLADLRRGGWQAKHWRSAPKHIALELERLRKRVMR